MPYSLQVHVMNDSNSAKMSAVVATHYCCFEHDPFSCRHNLLTWELIWWKWGQRRSTQSKNSTMFYCSSTPHSSRSSHRKGWRWIHPPYRKKWYVSLRKKWSIFCKSIASGKMWRPLRKTWPKKVLHAKGINFRIRR